MYTISYFHLIFLYYMYVYLRILVTMYFRITIYKVSYITMHLFSKT